jgi:hypothetical protein
MEFAHSEMSLSGVLHGRIAFDDHGTEDIEMQIPDITPDMDVFKLFANCIKERLVHLEARKRKHLSMLVQNIYKGVSK